MERLLGASGVEADGTLPVLEVVESGDEEEAIRAVEALPEALPLDEECCAFARL
jgi:hypothetical protein